MELATTQKLLARLFTDSRLRVRFYADPVSVGAEFGLCPESSRMLAEVPEDQIHDFSKSVRLQRLESVTCLLPCSVKCLGARFGEAFREYVLQSPLQAGSHAWCDAVDFNAFFQDWAAKNRGIPKWKRELVRYESDRLAFINNRERFSWSVSLFPGHRMVRRMQTGDVPSKVWPIPGLRVFWRWRPDDPMHEKLL
ncbi:MAG: hypothetical protein ISQ14_05800 [Verrucomicrobiae bacterium]|jgi:hypothetical protein|nr:hypothetical protein [Verrucomicrobiae bacterium]